MTEQEWAELCVAAWHDRPADDLAIRTADWSPGIITAWNRVVQRIRLAQGDRARFVDAEGVAPRDGRSVPKLRRPVSPILKPPATPTWPGWRRYAPNSRPCFGLAREASLSTEF